MVFVGVVRRCPDSAASVELSQAIRPRWSRFDRRCRPCAHDPSNRGEHDTHETDVVGHLHGHDAPSKPTDRMHVAEAGGRGDAEREVEGVLANLAEDEPSDENEPAAKAQLPKASPHRPGVR
jgi:hypothetical protein